MHQRKYFTSNFFINEIFSVKKFPNYGIYTFMYDAYNNAYPLHDTVINKMV